MINGSTRQKQRQKKENKRIRNRKRRRWRRQPKTNLLLELFGVSSRRLELLWSKQIIKRTSWNLYNSDGRILLHHHPEMLIINILFLLLLSFDSYPSERRRRREAQNHAKGKALLEGGFFSFFFEAPMVIWCAWMCGWWWSAQAGSDPRIIRPKSERSVFADGERRVSTHARNPTAA